LILSDIDQLEQELSDLRQRLSRSLAALDELSQVQSQMTSLSHTQQSLDATLAEAKQFLANPPEANWEPRLKQLESQLDTRYEQLQAQILNFRCDFDALTHQLQEDRGLQPGFSAMGEGDTASEGRLKWLESSIQHLNSSVYNERSTLQTLDRKVKTLKRTLDIVTVSVFVGFIALFVTFVMFRA
jgi:DNA repair exonuclease SbcCD ATPase subunit